VAYISVADCTGSNLCSGL